MYIITILAKIFSVANDSWKLKIDYPEMREKTDLGHVLICLPHVAANLLIQRICLFITKGMRALHYLLII